MKSAIEREWKPLVPFDQLKVVDGKIKVDVYRNLRKGCWSVRHRGKVVAHADGLDLEDVQFVVNAKGRDRVRREKKKYVHAFVRGYLNVFEFEGQPWGWHFTALQEELTTVKYNPYKNDTFVTGLSLYPVHTARGAYLDPWDVFAIGVTNDFI